MSVIEVVIAPRGDQGMSQVRVVRSPAGEASTTVQLDAQALLARRAELQDAVLASVVSNQQTLDSAEQRVRKVGQTLFTALLGSGEVGRLYRESAAMAAESGQGLRVLLRIEEPALAGLPWEAMYDGAVATYVFPQNQLTRIVSAASQTAPLIVAPPLRILGVVSSPRGLPALDMDKEKELADRALSALSGQGLAELHWAPRATWADLQDLLQGDQWHVIHFIGHGGLDQERGEGYLALTREDGHPQLVQATRLVDLLGITRPMPRLVVLNSCAGGDAGATNMFSGTADALVRGGVNAVAAMQYEISDQASMTFTRGLYSALVHGSSVDDAVSSGRTAILDSSGGTLEWATPVLYARGEDSHLFALPESVLAADTSGAVDDSREPSQTGRSVLGSSASGRRDGTAGMAVVMCALSVEYLAMRVFLKNPRHIQHTAGSSFEVGDLADGLWQVALAMIGPGTASAGVIADRAIGLFAPDVLLSVGVAGALKNDLELGDVVVATRVDAYHPSSVAEDSRSRPRTWDAPHRLEQVARRLVVTGGWKQWLPGDLATSPPTIHFLPIAADEVVLRSGDAAQFAQLRLPYTGAAAIDMEGIGLAARVNAMPALVIRGISDRADESKTPHDRAGWSQRASVAAAAFAAALLANLDIHPRAAPTYEVLQTAAHLPGESTDSSVELDNESIADALDILNDLHLWRMAESRWEHVERILNVLEDALSANDGYAVRSATAELEQAAPVRATRIGSAPEIPAPHLVHDHLTVMARTLRDKFDGTTDDAVAPGGSGG